MKQCARLTLFVATLFNVLSAYPQALPLPAPAEQAPFLIRIPAGVQKLGAQQAPALLKEHLRLGGRDELAPLGLPVTGAGISVQRFQQYHGGVKVEHGVYRLHSRQGVPTVLSGELYRVPGDLSLQPALSGEQALLRALSYVGAQTYQWEVDAEEQALKKQRGDLRATYYPKEELVICRIYQQGRTRVTDGGLALAYKFDVYAARPLSRAYIYVDAHTGTIIGEDAILKHVDGTGHTRYSGPRTISATAANGVYRLRDASRGQGVEVYNLQTGTGTSAAVDFTDNDNQWTAAEHDNARKDNAALDAHWGATLTYDYFRNVHGRNSMDGNGSKITCYVHYGRDVINAFWNGSAVLFGDGGTRYDGTQVQPLTTLDITAHEIGHGLCQYTAGLVYRYESGALNEAFSDIWGAMVENYSGANKAMWTMGEDANFTIRSFSDPNRFGHPDTYLGQYWFTGDGDNGGVHYNSGVLNHWFYLLSVGKTGVNDHGESYAVTGIGAEKAARIAYRTESVYLTANSQYTDACIFSLQAAADLFGANSAEAVQTANAWRAVGVYQVAFAPSALSAAAASTTQVNVSWRDNATGETGYQVERSGSPAGGFTLAGTTGANATAFQDQGVPTDAVYYYRVRAVTGPGAYSAYSNTATVTLGTPPVIMSNGTVATCGAVFLDPGGTGDYPNNQYLVMTLTPATAGSSLRVVFNDFDTEAGADFLRIYDGGSTYAPLIGTYSGNSLPPAVTAANAGGQLTFQFSSGYYNERGGWRAAVSCLSPPAAPVSLRAAMDRPTAVALQWTDNATDEAGFAIERSLSPGAGFAQVGTAGPNATTYTDGNLITDKWYYYRVRAYKTDVYSLYSNEAAVAVGNPPILMGNASITTCKAVFMDSGGSEGYANNENNILTLSPASATSQLRIEFSTFQTESCCDYLAVYDGGSTSAPLIGTYRGYTLPPVINATNAEGKLTFRFVSDSSVTGSGWQAAVTCVPRPVPTIAALTPASGTVGTLVTITGTNLGNATAVRFSNNASVPFTQHTDSRITATVPAGAVSGPVQVVTPGGTATSAARFTVTKLVATIGFGNLTAIYDGTPKAATATTVPAGLEVILTYDGAATPPAGAGTYAVTATIRSEAYEGSAAGVLVIRKANAGLLATNLAQTYDGKAKTITFTTTPTGLPVEVTYAQGSRPPVNAGSYAFTAKVTDRNYEGSTQGTLVVGKAAQVITLPALPDRTFGEAHPELFAAASSGLPVLVALNGPAARQGNTLALTGPGKVTVTATQDGDDNHLPAAPVERSFCVLPPKPVIGTANSLMEVVLTSSSAEGNQWLRDGQPIAGATGASYRVTAAGSFAVKVSLAGCENVSDAVTLTDTEEKYAARGGFRVFPNPTPDQVKVSYAAPWSATPPKLIVYNAAGLQVSANTLSRQGEEWVVTVRLAGYKAGLYLFSLVDQDNHVIVSRKVVKE